MQQRRQTVGARIKRLREARGISRRELASQLRVDVTALAAWELGKYLPRDGHRAMLARALGIDLDSLLRREPDRVPQPIAAALLDTTEQLPEVLVELTRRARKKLRALRLAAPYATTPHVQQQWRTLVSERLLSRTIEVHRVEIFYDLRRLKEALSNILRYDGCAYFVKSFCPGLTEVAPAMGGYFFDDEEFLLGAYWTNVPPPRRSGLRLSGTPFREFFEAYWDAIWQRGALLNHGGAHDLSAVRTLALQLGLPPRKWKSFVEEASELKIGDGAPPLV